MQRSLAESDPPSKISGATPNAAAPLDSMMVRLNIAAKIWLSIGIFILGFVVVTILAQLQGMNLEGRLGTLAQALYPAALRSQEAEAAFEQAVKGFSDAVVVQEKSSLDRGVEGVRRTVEGLHEVAGIPGLAPERQVEAERLAAAAEQFLEAARQTYTEVLSNPVNIDPALQQHMLDLASRTNEIRNSIAALRAAFTQDLQQQLATLRNRSARLSTRQRACCWESKTSTKPTAGQSSIFWMWNTRGKPRRTSRRSCGRAARWSLKWSG